MSPSQTHKGRVVLHLCDKLGAGGASIHGVSRLLSWWFPLCEKQGYLPRLCVLRPRDKAGAYLEERGIEVRYLARSKFDPRTITDVIAEIRRLRPDLLHLHGYGAWTFGRLAARWTKTPVVLHEHMVDETVPFVQRISDKLLANDDPTCVVSQAVHEFCVQRRHIRPDNAFVVPNGVSLSEFQTPSQSSIDKLRGQLGIDADTPTIGAVGRLDPRKGYEYLIRAVPILRADYPNVVVIIAGDGELEEPLKRLSAHLGVEDNVKFLGFWRDVGALLAVVDVVAIPSLSEGFSLSAVEAMAMRKPIVSTNVGGLGEVLTHQESALIVQERDSEDLANKIIMLLRDPELAERLGRVAEGVAHKNYDIEESVEKICDIYEQTLSGRDILQSSQ